MDEKIIFTLLRKFLLVIGIIFLSSCEKNNQNEKPIVINSPQFKQVEGLTDKIEIEFYYKSNTDEKTFYCDINWADDQKIAGTCPVIQPGDYTYNLNFIVIETNKILASSSDQVMVEKNNAVEINLVLDLEIREEGVEESNLNSFLLQFGQLTNEAPTANAGGEQNVEPGTQVTLGGGNSTDSSEDTVTITVTPIEAANFPPIANAGSNQSVAPGTKVILDGSDSTDANDDDLFFSWILVSQPKNSSASLSDIQTQTPYITPDVIGEYQFELIVNDGTADSLKAIVIISAIEIANLPPTANAGLDLQVEFGDIVTLDGSESDDNDGRIASYRWTSNDSKVSLNSTGTAVISFTAPAVSVSTPSIFELTVTDNDGATASDTVVITIAPLNEAPVANAGSNQNVASGTKVILDGGDSADANSDDLFFSWILVSQPENSFASLSDIQTQTPYITPDVIGEYQIELIVNDGTTNSSKDSVTITAMSIDIANLPPTANAGLDLQVESGDIVTLDGNGSNDNDGRIVSYYWKSEDSNISLSSTYTASTNFIAPTVSVPTPYNIELTVTDNDKKTASHIAVVTVFPRSISLKAIASIRRTTVNLGTTITLDATASTDPVGAGLTYEWSVTSAPEGSIAILSNINIAMPDFEPDMMGNYLMTLTVSDGSLSNTTTLNFRVIDTSAVAKPEMVKIPDGKFQMGDETKGLGAGDANELPLHWVTITSFEMGKYEVTFDEYDQYLIATGRSIYGSFGDEATAAGGFRGQWPVASVNLNDISGYLDWLNTELGIAPYDPKRYRLPSEAEWEYAARAGTKTAFNIGDCINRDQASFSTSYLSYMTLNGNLVNCSDRTTRFNSSVVGSFAMNFFGLFDTHGNVSEWVEDCYHDSYAGAPVDGSAWVNNCLSGRVVRGGSWTNGRISLRSANRLFVESYFVNRFRIVSRGFRLARTLTARNEAPPIANAGSNLTITLNTEAIFDGGNSVDVKEHKLSFTWFLETQPENSTAVLINPQSQTPSITPDVIGEYNIELVVNDGLVDSTKDVITLSAIAANAVNIPPGASAGLNRQVISGDNVTLRGSSTDSDGSIESYSWRSIDNSVSLGITGAAMTTFIAPTVNALTAYTFEFMVTDNAGAIASDCVTITVVPPPPVEELNLTAVASTDRADVTVGEIITLDSTASTGSNRENITYEWGIISRPEGSSAFFSSLSSATPTFTPDAGGSYLIGLTVNDGLSTDATLLRLSVLP